jgi:hypothetical protein
MSREWYRFFFQQFEQIGGGLGITHNGLPDLQGGSGGNYYHLGLADYTGTGTGTLVRSTSPVLVTPALGTPSSGDITNCTGSPVLGWNSPTADLPMGGHKFTNITDAATANEFASFGQAQNSEGTFLTSVAGTNTITAALPVLSAYTLGQIFTLIPAVTNTGPVTIDINGIGAVAVTQNAGAALTGGELVAGAAYPLIYTGSSFLFSNPVSTPQGGYLRNRLLNGSMQLSAWGTTATVVAGTAVPTASLGYPCADRWFVYCVGGNVVAARVAGTGADQFNLQITGGAGVTSAGIGQRLPTAFVYDFTGKTCALSVRMANSLSLPVTWTVNYSTFSGPFGTIGAPTKTLVATGTFSTSPTMTNYVAQFAFPTVANLAVEVLFTVGAQTSGTWSMTNVQLEEGLATVFQRMLSIQESYYTARFLPNMSGAAGNMGLLATGHWTSATGGLLQFPFVAFTRNNVTGVTVTNPTSLQVTDAAGAWIPLVSITFVSAGLLAGLCSFTVAAGGVAGNATLCQGVLPNPSLLWTGAEVS